MVMVLLVRHGTKEFLLHRCAFACQVIVVRDRADDALDFLALRPELRAPHPVGQSARASVQRPNRRPLRRTLQCRHFPRLRFLAGSFRHHRL